MKYLWKLPVYGFWLYCFLHGGLTLLVSGIVITYLGFFALGCWLDSNMK